MSGLSIIAEVIVVNRALLDGGVHWPLEFDKVLFELEQGGEVYGLGGADEGG